MELSEAVKQVMPGADLDLEYKRLYGDMPEPTDFIRWHRALRQVPEEMIQKIRDTASLTPEEAFRKLYPGWVNKFTFVNAVMAAKKPAT